MSHYFVTGSKGFVGTHLVKKLQELGHEVETDMRYLHTKKYSAIIHLAAKTSISCDFDPDLIESNINLTREIFKVNTRIIFASSCSAAHLTNPYAYTKRYGEHLCSIHGNAVALRFQNIYGPGATRGIIWWLMQQPDGATIKVRGPELVRDYVYVDDVVDEIIRHLIPSGVHVDMEALRQAQIESEFTALELVRMAFEQNIFIGETRYITDIKVSGVFHVGTGLGMETMDVVNLYQKLSGKAFHIEIEEAGSNEPVSMVANRSIPNFTTLEDGLKKMIND